MNAAWHHREPVNGGLTAIYLYPYGGGAAASYRAYARSYPAEAARIVPVEIPGRGARVAEPFAASIRECAERCLDQVEPAQDYILHGHCMGALIAFETVKLIAARGWNLPRVLVASGRNAPHLVNDWLLQVEAMDDRALFAHLLEMGGIPKGLSFAMAQPALQMIRRDQAMFSGYEPGGERISVPILTLAGQSDRMTTPDGLAEWQTYTSAACQTRWFEGQHYFLLDQAVGIANEIAAFALAVTARSNSDRS